MASGRFCRFSPWSAARLGVDIPGADFLVDHHILRHANHLAISNSSFSFTAAMLNAHAGSFLRPDPTLQELVAFDPWASEVLWDAMVEPQAVAADERLLIQNRILPTDTVVYWGTYCSAWTNFARSVHSSLRIFETESDASVTDTLRRRKIRHVRLLVVENTDILYKFFNSNNDIVDQARIDMVLFRLGADRDIDVISREFSTAGYIVFRLRKILLWGALRANRMGKRVIWQCVRIWQRYHLVGRRYISMREICWRDFSGGRFANETKVNTEMDPMRAAPFMIVRKIRRSASLDPLAAAVLSLDMTLVPRTRSV